jgi:hypothetical protein
VREDLRDVLAADQNPRADCWMFARFIDDEQLRRLDEVDDRELRDDEGVCCTNR